MRLGEAGRGLGGTRSPAATARSLLGPSVRRARRELQWRARGLDFRVRPGPAEDFPHAVARHTTPLIRPLSGLDLELQRNKVVNLQLAVKRLDGLVVAPGRRLSFWRQVGKPTYRRGFLDGMVLDHGRIGAGVGAASVSSRTCCTG